MTMSVSHTHALNKIYRILDISFSGTLNNHVEDNTNNQIKLFRSVVSKVCELKATFVSRSALKRNSFFIRVARAKNSRS